MADSTRRRKLIEVAPFLPLDAISIASKADKDKKTGTIKNVHKWFAPMPTPALRALIFAAMVDAPDDETERARLLQLVERLVPADGKPPDADTLAEAQSEIVRCHDGEPPVVFDPFCGGGSTLIEAQRLGLRAVGSDLNPVPALISRTLTELIPQVAGRPPLVGDPSQLGNMAGGPLDGILADVRHYAERVRDQVWEEVGHLYPTGPDGETVIAWLWAWSITCPNPACGRTMPLLSSTILSKRNGSVTYLQPVPTTTGVDFKIASSGSPADPAKAGRGGSFRCLSCGELAAGSEVKRFGVEHGLGQQLLCVAVDRDGTQQFLPAADLPAPSVARPPDAPNVALADDSRAMWSRLYGLDNYADHFTNRQLEVLGRFATAVSHVPEKVNRDGGSEIYGAAIASLLGLALGKLAQSSSTQARWYVDNRNGSALVQAAFSRHALPLLWDFVELNPFCERHANWVGVTQTLLRGVASLPVGPPASVRQADSRDSSEGLDGPAMVITDPPYFDQIGYADLADYFYIWHRRALRDVHPDLYGTIATPKESELIATPHRHNGDRGAAARYFIDGFTETFRSLREAASADHPILIVYAHRQEERSSLGSASTGWDAMLEAVLAAGLTIEGTLPIRGTGSTRQIGLGTNSLASYIVMVCRPRGDDLRPGAVSDFRSELRRRLPPAVEVLLASGESMVDIRQAAIGPGMEVFCQFREVYDGSDPIPVRRALTIINDELGRLLDEHLGVVDDETRWAAQWYGDHGYDQGDYDEAHKLAGAFGLGVEGLDEAGIVASGGGNVRLLTRDELPAEWDPSDDARIPAWEACQHAVKRLGEGETAAAALVAALGPDATGLRELAQYLANLAIEKGWTDEAIAYDGLVKSWPRVEELATRGDLDDGRLFAG